MWPGTTSVLILYWRGQVQTIWVVQYFMDSVEQVARNSSEISGCFACSSHAAISMEASFFISLFISPPTGCTIHSATRFQQDCHLLCSVFNIFHTPGNTTHPQIQQGYVSWASSKQQSTLGHFIAMPDTTKI
jgi:hypothetical protein